MILVLGLGNPGKKYERSRHNVGFSVIDETIKHLDLSLTTDVKKSMEKGTTVINGEKVMFVKPLTFMNASGDIFPYFRGEEISKVIVCVDNMDLPAGKARFKYQGSSAGHNGLKSIIAHFGNNFYRLYIGVGRPNTEVCDYVLGKISGADKVSVDEAVERASRALIHFLENGDVEKMQRELSV